MQEPIEVALLPENSRAVIKAKFIYQSLIGSDLDDQQKLFVNRVWLRFCYFFLSKLHTQGIIPGSEFSFWVSKNNSELNSAKNISGFEFDLLSKDYACCQQDSLRKLWEII